MLVQGVMNMLEAIRATGLTHSVKFYQASTSELYGKVQHSKLKLRAVTRDVKECCKIHPTASCSACALQCLPADIAFMGNLLE